jgi:hypothetical protein
MIPSTRHARTEDPFPKQHYLSRHGGQWVWGYFPWNGSVIVVGFDGSRPDSLQHIKENSVCELLTVDAARRHWNERLEWEYSAVDPKDWAALTYRNTVHGIAVDFLNTRRSKQTNTVQEMLEDLLKGMPIKEHNSEYEVHSDYTPTDYALKA